jgi:hypothetical protein
VHPLEVELRRGNGDGAPQLLRQRRQRCDADAPARREAVEEQAHGRARGVGERAHESGPGLERGEGRDHAAQRLVAGEGHADARVLGESFVQLQRGFQRVGAGIERVTLGAEQERIADVAADGNLAHAAGIARLAARSRVQGRGKRAQFEPQPETTVAGCEVRGRRVRSRQLQLRLHAVEGLVRQQRDYVMHGVGQWEHGHRPLPAAPLDCRVRNQAPVGPPADTHGADGRERVVRIRCIRQREACARIDEHDGTAQTRVPQQAGVVTAGLIVHPERALGRCDGRRVRNSRLARERQRCNRRNRHGHTHHIPADHGALACHRTTPGGSSFNASSTLPSSCMMCRSSPDCRSLCDGTATPSRLPATRRP